MHADFSDFAAAWNFHTDCIVVIFCIDRVDGDGPFGGEIFTFDFAWDNCSSGGIFLIGIWCTKSVFCNNSIEVALNCSALADGADDFGGDVTERVAVGEFDFDPFAVFCFIFETSPGPKL